MSRHSPEDSLTTVFKVMGLKTSVTTWRPVYQEARETLVGTFSIRGKRPGSTKVPFFQLCSGATQTMAVQLKVLEPFREA